MRENIVIIGESLLEMSLPSNIASEKKSSFNTQFAYGGDTLNTALYLSRLGIDTDYITALGDDNLSSWLINVWNSEGIGTTQISKLAGMLPGLYMIKTDASGERSFYYWRNQSAAKKLFSDADLFTKVLNNLKACAYIYLTGITLALFSQSCLASFLEFMTAYRKNGGKLIFDSNYRPKLWSHKNLTIESYQKIYKITDIALPTIDDEIEVYAESDHNKILHRLHNNGVAEIALKSGENGCWVSAANAANKVEKISTLSVNAIDTTGAGDAFNAGYIAARINGESPADSAKKGHNLASQVVQVKGAILPKIN